MEGKINTISNANLFKLTFYTGITKTILTIIIGVISVPFALNYFGIQKYGVWNVITSFIVFLSMTNLGLNEAATILINKNNDFRIKILILNKSIKILAIVIPFILLILTSINYFFPNWISILNSPKIIEPEAKNTAIIMVIFSLINLPFSLISSGLNGFQKNYIENIFSILSLFISTISMFYIIYFKKNLIFYAYLVGYSTLFFNIIKYFYFRRFIIYNNSIDTRIDYQINNETSYKFILLTGYRCMLGTIASMVVLNTDNIVIAKILGVEFVTPFSVTFKLCTIIFALIYLINSSIIPLIGKNIEDMYYLNKIYSKTLYTSIFIGGLFWVGIIAFGKTLIFLWVGKNGYAGFFVLLFLGGYSYIFSIINLNNIIINSLNLIKGFFYITWFEGLLNLSFSIFLAKYFGLAGIAGGTFLAGLISPLFLGSLFLKKRSQSKIKQNNKIILKHFFISVAPSILMAYIINISDLSLILTTFFTILLCLFYFIVSYLSLSKEFKNLSSLNIFKFNKLNNIT